MGFLTNPRESLYLAALLIKTICKCSGNAPLPNLYQFPCFGIYQEKSHKNSFAGVK